MFLGNADFHSTDSFLSLLFFGLRNIEVIVYKSRHQFNLKYICLFAYTVSEYLQCLAAQQQHNSICFTCPYVLDFIVCHFDVTEIPIWQKQFHALCLCSLNRWYKIDSEKKIFLFALVVFDYVNECLGENLLLMMKCLRWHTCVLTKELCVLVALLLLFLLDSFFVFV